MRGKEVFTTGEVAKLCQVAPRTVSKWFDSGKLSGYRIPGSKDRRIPVESLRQFMHEHHIPSAGLQTGRTRVLVVDQVEDADDLAQILVQRAGYEARSVDGLFTAGLEAESFEPHALLINLHLAGVDAKILAQQIRLRPNLQAVALIGLTDRLTEGQAAGLQRLGFKAVLRKPFSHTQAVEIIEQTLSQI